MYTGVDEAGRGPVMGPLVVAGVSGDPESLPAGVTDSKRLTPARRAELYAAISDETALRLAVREVSAAELNQRMRADESLNEIEASAFVDVLRELDAGRAVVDTVGPRPARFAAALTARLDGACHVEARVKADASDPMVGAASIVAKVTRDRAIQTIAGELDADIGSGYPSDPTTRAFLVAWRKRSQEPPPHARVTWATLADLGFGTPSLFTFDTAGPSSPVPARGGNP